MRVAFCFSIFCTMIYCGSVFGRSNVGKFSKSPFQLKVPKSDDNRDLREQKGRKVFRNGPGMKDEIINFCASKLEHLDIRKIGQKRRISMGKVFANALESAFDRNSSREHIRSNNRCYVTVSSFDSFQKTYFNSQLLRDLVGEGRTQYIDIADGDRVNSKAVDCFRIVYGNDQRVLDDSTAMTSKTIRGILNRPEEFKKSMNSFLQSQNQKAMENYQEHLGEYRGEVAQWKAESARLKAQGKSPNLFYQSPPLTPEQLKITDVRIKPNGKCFAVKAFSPTLKYGREFDFCQNPKQTTCGKYYDAKGNPINTDVERVGWIREQLISNSWKIKDWHLKILKAHDEQEVIEQNQLITSGAH